jgi:hypothetical protein
VALQLCHGYGSKHLIETLHAFGICASYTEVRQLLTSVANHEIAKTEVSSSANHERKVIREGGMNCNDLWWETSDGEVYKSLEISTVCKEPRNTFAASWRIYSTAKLQTRFQNHYGDTIVIESQKGQGQSNISRYFFSFIPIHFNYLNFKYWKDKTKWK